MAELLTPLRTTTTAHNDASEEEYKSNDETNPNAQRRVLSAEDVLETLESKPGYDLLMKALLWLVPRNKENHGFDIYRQAPLSTQILRTLISVTIPDYWSTAEATRKVQMRTLRDLIVAYLSSVPGLAAIANRLKELLGWEEGAQGRRQTKETEQARQLEELLNLLESVLQQPAFISRIWHDLNSSHVVPEKRLFVWRELVNLLASGRILSLAAEASQVSSKGTSVISPSSWISDGAQFSAWVGRNLEHMLVYSKDSDKDILKAWVQILERALNLGHPGKLEQ